MSEPRKIGMTIPVSTEVLHQYQDISDAILIAMGLQPDPRTPEQIAEASATWERESIEARARITEEHAQHLAAATDLGRAVLTLHAPVLDSYGPGAHCDGCDSEGYESEAPSWPCRTYELVSGWRP